MATPTKTRIETGDRVSIHPANGHDPYKATLTDLGSWGPTVLIGTTLRFLPWAAIDLIERIDPDAEPEWCPAAIHTGDGPERCDLRVGHDGAHRGERTGRRFGGNR